MGTIRIGTRESQLAVWQATHVKELLAAHAVDSELVFIRSEGDIDLVTPLYDIGVQGIFTRSLDASLLSNHIDVAVHSMKDVPVKLAHGISQAAVLERGSYKDIFVPNPRFPDVNRFLDQTNLIDLDPPPIIATSSIRRIAQWCRRYRHHQVENLRGNVNTRMRKLKESNWRGAIFAAAGLERIGLRPDNAIDLDWMLPAPAQGAIMVVCRQGDRRILDACRPLDHLATAMCTKIERDFLSALMGGCSTPISAIAEVNGEEIIFRGNIVDPVSYQMQECHLKSSITQADKIGFKGAEIILANGGQVVIDTIRNAAK